MVGWWVDSDVRDAQGGHLLLVELLALVVLPPVCIKYKHKDTSTTVCLGPSGEGGPAGEHEERGNRPLPLENHHLGTEKVLHHLGPHRHKLLIEQGSPHHRVAHSSHHEHVIQGYHVAGLNSLAKQARGNSNM